MDLPAQDASTAFCAINKKKSLVFKRFEWSVCMTCRFYLQLIFLNKELKQIINGHTSAVMCEVLMPGFLLSEKIMERNRKTITS